MDKPNLDDVLKNLRSVTQSCKGGVPFNRLDADFRFIMGYSIPFKELGYSSLEAFIRDNPHIISLKNKNGELVTEGVPDASTAHIVSLVSRQKESVTRRIGRGYRRFPSHVGTRRGFPTRYTSRGTSRSSFSNTNSYSMPNANSYSMPSTNSHSMPNTNSHSIPEKSRQRKPAQEVYSVRKNSSSSSRSDYRQPEVAPRFRRLQEQKAVHIVPDSPTTSPSHSVWSSSSHNGESGDVYDEDVAVQKPRPLSNFSVNVERTTELASLESAKTAKEFVDIYAKRNKISGTYRTLPMGQKSKGFVSSLILGSKTYKSYPEVKPTEREAEEEAAKNAMIAIKESKEHLSMFPETRAGNAEEIQILLSRIEEIVCEKPSGMFTNGIIREYENKFSERLPQNWMDLLKLSNYIDIDALDVPYGKIPEGANYIVRPTKELSSGNATPSSNSSKTEFLDDLDAKALKNSLVNISSNKIPQIKVPDGNMWDVYISTINGFLAARLFDCSEDFLALGQKMKQFYQRRNFPVTDVFENKLYVGYDANEDGDWWHRVLAVDVIDDEQINCYFVDEGEFGTMTKADLQEISPEFKTLPYQAIRISLDDLEDYENWIKYQDLKEILGRTFVAEVKRWWTASEFLPQCSGVHRVVYSVVLYDTSDEKENVNINEWLKSTVIKALECKLPKVSTSTCAYLSHVTSDGLVFIRLIHPETCWIESQLEKLSPTFETESAKTAALPVNTMCAVKYENDCWHRAIISKYLDDGQVEVFFVDYGNTAVVEKSDICELKKIDKQLAVLSYQAMCCELIDALPNPNSKWTEAATKKLLELAPFNEEIIIKVFSESEMQNRAKINMFKRNKDSLIISINHTLSCSTELFQEQSSAINVAPSKIPSALPLKQSSQNVHKTSVSRVPSDMSLEEQMPPKALVSPTISDQIDWLVTPDNIKSPDGFEIQSPAPLSLPEVPDEGDFDVFVTMAAHPHHFIVQPFKSCKEMNNLGVRMQQFYSSDENLCEMHLSLLKENNYYAALHKDRSWYRVRLEKVIPGDHVMVTVYFVDFGDFNTIMMSDLQPLFQEFRHLPCQAIKASLADVKPFDKDWSPVDCIRFQEMVTEKSFVSIIRNKKIVNKNNVPSIELELTLIDTSTEKDVYLYELLIQKRLAKPVNETKK